MAWIISWSTLTFKSAVLSEWSRNYIASKGRCQCKALAREPENTHHRVPGLIRRYRKKNAQKYMRRECTTTRTSPFRTNVPCHGGKLAVFFVLFGGWILRIKGTKSEVTKQILFGRRTMSPRRASTGAAIISRKRVRLVMETNAPGRTNNVSSEGKKKEGKML